MFSLPPTFGYDDPHIRHVHEYNTLYYNQKQEQSKTSKQQMPSTKTTNPILTGTSVLGITYKDGVMIVGDTLASYGSMARFTDVRRIIPVGKFTIVGASGEYSDFQYIEEVLDQLTTEDEITEDGSLLTPHSIHSYLTRVMYERRNKFDPIYNYVIVGGYRDGKSFLAYTDLLGVNFTGNTVATGYGAYIAEPLLRRYWKADMTYQEAKDLLDSCMRVLYYRDARALNRLTLGTITAEGPKISEPYALATDWSSGMIDFSGYKLKNVPIVL